MAGLLPLCPPRRCYISMKTKSQCLVKVSGLSKSYGRRRVLNQLEFEVESGSGFVIRGSNGSGKTTFLETLSTISRPDEGSIVVCGVSLKEDSAFVRSKIGLVAHSSYLYPQLTVKENLVFFSRLNQVPPQALDENILLSQMGLDTRLNQRVSTLSHGFQKRVSIVRSMLHCPEVLLLDEPETGLDEETLSVLKGLIKAFLSDGGSVILTTHLDKLDYGSKMENLFLKNGKLMPLS